MKLKTVLQIFGGISVILTLFPFISADYWWVRIFDFPHLQLTVLSVIAFLVYFFRFDFKRRSDYIFASALLLCMGYQFSRIYTYTPLAPFEILAATTSDKDRQLSFYTANVLQKNDESQPLISEVKKYDADILLFTETDLRWKNTLSTNFSDKYPHKVEVPLPNTYGMMLYSKFELIAPTVQFQVEDSIPSIHTKVRLTSGDIVQLFAIHPTPPMPQHNPKSTERDKEMMLTATRAKDSKLPSITIGDFNDVAWSQTTRLFQRVSGQLDPRKGRGMYNTFNAKSILMRWPLDHIFVSPEFRVIRIEKGKDINSDHFPMYASFSFEPKGADAQRLDSTTQDELEAAEKQIKGEITIDMD